MKPLMLILLFCPALLVAAEPVVQVGLFSRGNFSGWQEKSFDGVTEYQLVNNDDRTVLRAQSHGAASGRFKEVKIDLEKTPILHWSWRVANLLEGVDERIKAGDDYPARVYVVFSGGLFFWRTRAINYVWSSNQPEGASWSNAFTANARMVAVQSGPRQLGRWVSEQRNVAEDYRRLFGEEPGNVDAVAIMTDTDNSGQSATAWYGDIWFAAEAQ